MRRIDLIMLAMAIGLSVGHADTRILTRDRAPARNVIARQSRPAPAAGEDGHMPSTSGLPLAIKISESFAGTAFPPAGWTAVNRNGGEAWARYTTNPYSTPACASCSYDVPNDDWLITPPVAITSGDQLAFWIRAQSTSYNDSVQIWVSTSDTALASFAYVASVMNSSTTYSRRTVDLSAFAGATCYIAFAYRADDQYRLYIDDVTVGSQAANDLSLYRIRLSPGMLMAGTPDSALVCVENPGANAQTDFGITLHVNGATTDAAVLSLAPGGRDSVSLQFTAAGGVMNLWAVHSLAPDGDPGNDTARAWAYGCAPGALIYEGFEGAAFPPAGWVSYNNAGASCAWARDMAMPHGGTASAWIVWDTTGGDDWLVTPQFTPAANTGFSFWLYPQYTGYPPDSLQLLVSTSDNQMSSFTTELLKLTDADYIAGAWTKYTIDLSGYDGTPLYLAFRHGDVYGDGLYLDDVAAGPPPANDLAMSSMATTGYPFTVGAPESLSVMVKNIGTADQNDYHVTFDVDGATVEDLHVTDVLAAGSSAEFMFHFTPVTEATLLLTAAVTVADDADSWNDSLTWVESAYSSQAYFAEGFDYISEFPPAGWAMVPVGSSTWWLYTGIQGHSGQLFAAIEQEDDAGDMLVTPQITLSPGAADSLSFWYQGYAVNPSERLQVWAMTGPGAADTVPTASGGLLFDQTFTTTAWTNARIGIDDLEALALDSIRIGFLNAGNGSSGYSLVDDVSLLRGGAAGVTAGQPAGGEGRTALLSCRPNPAAGAATIRYQIGARAGVRLRVYNIAGQLVRTLAAGVRGPGVYDAVWDCTDGAGRKVAAGIYLYTLTAGTRTFARKIAVVK